MRSGWEWNSLSQFSHSLWSQVEHAAWAEDPQMVQASTANQETNDKNIAVNKNKTMLYYLFKKVVIWLTLSGFLYFVSLVIGSGRVAVKEAIARIAERLIVTRRAKQSWCGTTQVTVTRWSRAWKVRNEMFRYRWWTRGMFSAQYMQSETEQGVRVVLKSIQSW